MSPETHYSSDKKFFKAIEAGENHYKRKIRAVRLTLERVIGSGYFVYFAFELHDYSVEPLSRRWFPPDEKLIEKCMEFTFDITRRHRLHEGPHIAERATHPDCEEDMAPHGNIESKLYKRIVDIQNDLSRWRLSNARLIERKPDRTSGGCEIIVELENEERTRRTSVKCFSGYPWSAEMVKECAQWAKKIASDHRVPFKMKSQAY